MFVNFIVYQNKKKGSEKLKLYFLTYILFCVLSINLAFSQHIDSLQVNEMKKVQWLVGKWEGEGWMMFGPEEKHTFSQIETVTSKLNGLLLAIEGLGTIGTSDERESRLGVKAASVGVNPFKSG